jgi:hypothetical protein
MNSPQTRLRLKAMAWQAPHRQTQTFYSESVLNKNPINFIWFLTRFTHFVKIINCVLGQGGDFFAGNQGSIINL